MLCQQLFDHFLEAEEYSTAAGYLAGINVETSARAFSASTETAAISPTISITSISEFPQLLPVPLFLAVAILFPAQLFAELTL